MEAPACAAIRAGSRTNTGARVSAAKHRYAHHTSAHAGNVRQLCAIDATSTTPGRRRFRQLQFGEPGAHTCTRPGKARHEQRRRRPASVCAPKNCAGCMLLWHDIQYFSRINPASHCPRNIECHTIGLCMARRPGGPSGANRIMDCQDIRPQTRQPQQTPTPHRTG